MCLSSLCYCQGGYVLKSGNGDVIDKVDVPDYPQTYDFSRYDYQESFRTRLHDDRITISFSGNVRRGYGFYYESEIIGKGVTMNDITFNVFRSGSYFCVSNVGKKYDVFKIEVSEDLQTAIIYKGIFLR